MQIANHKVIMVNGLLIEVSNAGVIRDMSLPCAAKQGEIDSLSDIQTAKQKHGQQVMVIAHVTDACIFCLCYISLYMYNV